MYLRRHVAYSKPPNYAKIKTVHLACKVGDLSDVTQFVEKNKLLLDALENDNTPLYYACLCGHPEIVRYLLGKGAKDDKFGRCYLNALTVEIREILRRYMGDQFYKGIHNSSSVCLENSMEETMGSLFQQYVIPRESAATVLQRMIAKHNKQAAPTTSSNAEDGADSKENALETCFSDFKIVVTSWPSKVINVTILDEQSFCTGSFVDPASSSSSSSSILQEDSQYSVFNAHLCVLLSRWKYLRKVLCDSEDISLVTNEELVEKMVKKNIGNLKNKIMLIQGIHPDMMKLMLRYLYCGEFKLDDILAIATQENRGVEDEGISKKYIVEFTKGAILFGLDVLKNLIIEQCTVSKLNVSFAHYGITLDQEEAKNYKKAHLPTSYKKSFSPGDYALHVEDRGTWNPGKFLYEMIDKVIQKYALICVSDILVRSTTSATPEEEFLEQCDPTQEEPLPEIPSIEEDEEANENGTTTTSSQLAVAEPSSSDSNLIDDLEFIYCHRCILMSRCEYFRVIISGPFNDASLLEKTIAKSKYKMPELVLQECSFQTLMQVISYIYTESSAFTLENAVEVLLTSSRLSLTDLKQQAIEWIITRISEENMLQVIKVSEMVQAPKLLKKAFQFAKQCAKKTAGLKEKLRAELLAMQLSPEALEEYDELMHNVPNIPVPAKPSAKPPAKPGASKFVHISPVRQIYYSPPAPPSKPKVEKVSYKSRKEAEALAKAMQRKHAAQAASAASSDATTKKKKKK